MMSAANLSLGGSITTFITVEKSQWGDKPWVLLAAFFGFAVFSYLYKKTLESKPPMDSDYYLDAKRAFIDAIPMLVQAMNQPPVKIKPRIKLKAKVR